MDKNTKKIFNLIIFFGILLRIFKISSQSVWVDEYITANLANGRDIFYVFWDALANNPHPPLFFIMEFFLVKLIGVSEFSIRILPCIFSIISLFVFYKIVRSFYSEKISLIALFLFSFNPYQIYYAQEARMYSLFMLVSMIIVYYFLLSIKYNSFLFLSFTFCSIIGLYIHNYTLLLILILNLLVFVKYKDEIRINLWIKSNIFILIFFLPLLLFFIKGITGEGYSHKINIFLAPIFTFKNHILGLTIDFNLFSVFGLIIILGLILNAILTYRDKTKKITDIITEIIIFFISIPWIESITGKPVYSDRTLIIISPFFLILLAIGASYLSQRGLFIFIIMIFLLYFNSLNNYYFNEKYQKINYREQFLKISSQMKEGDIILHTNVNSYASFEFYNKLKYKKNYENRLLQEIPEFTGSKIKFFIRELWRKFKEKFKIDVYSGYDKNIMPISELKERIKNLKRIWLIVDNEIGIKQVWISHGNIWYSNKLLAEPYKIEHDELIRNHFLIKDKFEFYGGTVFLLEKK